VADDAEAWIVERIGDVFGTDNTLESTVGDLFAGPNTGVFTVGIVLTVYAASRGFTAVVKALDVAYDHEHRRGFVATLAVGVALTVLSVLVAAVLIVMLLVGPLFGEGEVLADRVGLGSQWATAWEWLRWPVAALVLVGWAATMFHLAPAHRGPWRWEVPGALVSAAWWIVVTLGFNRYLAFASEGANAVFGLLGGALSLLFWLYLMAMGLLVGAEINGILASRYGVRLDHDGEADTATGG
jgi:membrane protein